MNWNRPEQEIRRHAGILSPQVGVNIPRWLLDKWQEEAQERARLAAYHANSA